MQWISVEDRLPNVNTSDDDFEDVGVIVCVKGSKQSQYRTYERAYVRGKEVYRWKYPWGSISDEVITYWMHLPSLPSDAQPPQEG